MAESPDAHIPDSTSGTLTSFFPRVLFSSIHDSFARSFLPAHAPKMHIALLLRGRRLLRRNGAGLLWQRPSAHFMAPVQRTIDGLIAQNRLHIIARLSKGNRLHKL